MQLQMMVSRKQATTTTIDRNRHMVCTKYSDVIDVIVVTRRHVGGTLNVNEN